MLGKEQPAAQNSSFTTGYGLVEWVAYAIWSPFRVIPDLVPFDFFSENPVSVGFPPASCFPYAYWNLDPLRVSNSLP